MAIGTTMPCCLQARLKSATMRSRSCGSGVDRHEVVVVEVDAPGADLAEHRDGIHRRQRRTHRFTKRIAAAVADGPETKREFVLRTW